MESNENALGKKIRALRLQKGMTQAALAGDTVTRNMLSQIENGVAQPSVTTIIELAKRLEVPTEYFFSERGSVGDFRKLAVIERIRSAFAEGLYGRCIYRLDRLGVSDEETEYLWAESHFALGVENYREGKLRSAMENFEKALLHAEKTHYVTEEFRYAVSRYMAAIRLVRDKTETDGNPIPSGISDRMADIGYIRRLTDEPKKPGRDTDEPYEKHLAIRECMKKDEADPTALLAELKALLDGQDEKRYAVLRYYALGDMEMLAQKTGDYKLAYECAAARLEIFEKMNA